MDASEIYARRLNAKEVLTPQRSGNFILPVADGTVKICGGKQRLRTSTFNRERSEASENKIILEENQTESLLQPHIKMTQHGMMRKLKMTSGVLQKISFIAITWTQSPTVHTERRIISYSAEVHRRYQNNTYSTGCIVGENIDD